MSKSDYGLLIDYSNDALDEILPLKQKADNTTDGNQYERLMDRAERLFEKYQYWKEALEIVSEATDYELGRTNVSERDILIRRMADAISGLQDRKQPRPFMRITATWSLSRRHALK